MQKLNNSIMKKVILLMTVLLGSYGLTIAQQAGANIQFEKDLHDFGELTQGDVPAGQYEFKFTNTGTEPLIISKAKGSCGCTVPEWPKNAIDPGTDGVIKVKYDVKRVGPFTKFVTITSNASDNPSKQIQIKGSVKATPTEETMPVKDAEFAPIADPDDE
jgi:hypothetical protein